MINKIIQKLKNNPIFHKPANDNRIIRIEQ